jgi:hypothetical protein
MFEESAVIRSRRPLMSWSNLPPEQAELARQIYEQLRHKQDDRLKELAALLASKPDHQLLGQAEFEVRDLVHQMGADAIETAAERRKKGGTEPPR